MINFETKFIRLKIIFNAVLVEVISIFANFGSSHLYQGEFIEYEYEFALIYTTEQPETKAMTFDKCSYHKNTGQYRERQKNFTSIVK